MNSIVVFCGAGEGNKACYKEAAQQLGAALAARNITVIYGGARIGIMGAVADAALAAGGKVIGVIPQFLKTKEVAHDGLTELISDGIITLPGGWGPMEELFEMLTWAQLGLHSKPVGLLNVNGYYNALTALCDNMVGEGFLPTATRRMLLTDESVANLLVQMNAYKPTDIPHIITTQNT